MAMYYYANKLSEVACQHRCRLNAVKTNTAECKDQAVTFTRKQFSRCNGPSPNTGEGSSKTAPNAPSTSDAGQSDALKELAYQNDFVISGTLEALINLLIPTDDYTPDKEFIFVFLLACRIYIRPHELLSKLCHRIAENKNKTPQEPNSPIKTHKTLLSKSISRKTGKKTNTDESKNKNNTTENDLQMANRYSKMVENEAKALETRCRNPEKCKNVVSSSHSSSHLKLYECHSIMADSNPSVNGTDYKIHAKHKMSDSEAKMADMIMLLSEWTENFPYDFQDELVMAHVRSITQKCVNEPPYLRARISTLLQRLLCKLTALEQYEKRLRANHKIEEIDFLTLASNAKHLSEQIALIEYERLFYIGYEEYVIMDAILLETDPKRPNLPPSYFENVVSETNKKIWNLEAYIDWLERLMLVVGNEICKLTSTSSRSTIIHLWVSTAQCCLQAGNAITAAAILVALSATPVQRLQHSWNAIPSTLKQFNALQRQLEACGDTSNDQSTVKNAESDKQTHSSLNDSSRKTQQNQMENAKKKKHHALQNRTDVKRCIVKRNTFLTATNRGHLRQTSTSMAATSQIELFSVPILNEFLCDVVDKREECAARLSNGHLNFTAFRELAVLVRGKGVTLDRWPGEGEWPHQPSLPESQLAQYLLNCPLMNEPELLLTSFDKESPSAVEKDIYHII